LQEDVYYSVLGTTQMHYTPIPLYTLNYLLYFVLLHLEGSKPCTTPTAPPPRLRRAGGYCALPPFCGGTFCTFFFFPACSLHCYLFLLASVTCLFPLLFPTCTPTYHTRRTWGGVERKGQRRPQAPAEGQDVSLSLPRLDGSPSFVAAVPTYFLSLRLCMLLFWTLGPAGPTSASTGSGCAGSIDGTAGRHAHKP